jgi:hypothetical protein
MIVIQEMPLLFSVYYFSLFSPFFSFYFARLSAFFSPLFLSLFRFLVAWLHSPLCSLPPTNLGRIEEGRKERRSEGESRARGTGKQHQEEESRETAVIRVRESRCLSKVVSDFLFLCLTAATTITNYTEAQRRRACMDVAFHSHNNN